MKIIAGSASKKLGNAIALELGISISDANITRYSDQEINVEVTNDLHGHEVFVVQSTSLLVNDNLMELLLIIDAVKRVGAKKVTSVIPYYGYSRQDRTIRNGDMHSALSAKLVANLIKTAGADHVIAVDLHSNQIEGFFDVPISNINCFEVFADFISQNMQLENTVIVAPDVGALSRARNFAKALLSKYKTDLSNKIVIVDKYREKAGTSQVMQVIGEVCDKDCVIIDDIVDSAGTLCNSALALQENGAKSIIACITHGVLSGSALDKISSSVLNKLVITDTVSYSGNLHNKKVEIVSIADVLAKAISFYGG